MSPPIVVIGASAGGVEAASRIVRDLPRDFPGAVLVAMHFPWYSTSVLPRILERAGQLPAAHAVHGEEIKGGRIYVAPPDRHLLVMRRTLHLARGPRENGNRPAIDPMFRSAAVAHDGHCVGVILTGNLDDGTAGLLTIKRRGGVAIVQDPHDAMFSSMPQSAIEHVPHVDYVIPLDSIAERVRAEVERLDAVPVGGGNGAGQDERDREMDEEAKRETGYAELNLDVIEEVERHPGRVSQFGCPDCGGVLWQIDDGGLTRFRCRVGHAWSADGLLSSQSDQLENALWVALRALEETASWRRRRR